MESVNLPNENAQRWIMEDNCYIHSGIVHHERWNDPASTRPFDDLVGRSFVFVNVNFVVSDVTFFQKSLGISAVSAPLS